jgi:hypothetical protein
MEEEFDSNISGQVQHDFDRARMQEAFSSIFSILSPEDDELIALDDVRALFRSNAQSYKGVLPIKIADIVGSEGRYRDFNRHFLPKKTHLRQRWESIDKAHYNQTTLPPIKVYKISGLYFVRDGNHRVSVAKMQGVEFIDAEITTLDSEIALDRKMSKKEILRSVIDYEKMLFFEKTDLDRLRPGCAVEFTSVGRYEEIIHHINVHKYYLNEGKEDEIPFEDAMISWYDHVFLPIITSIEVENVLTRFPNRTAADLYVWIVHYWDRLKHKYGKDYPIKQAVLEYTKKHGEGFFRTMSVVSRRLIHNLLSTGIQSV